MFFCHIKNYYIRFVNSVKHAIIILANKGETKKGRYTNLKITDVRVRIVNKEDAKLKAVASITIDDCIVVHDIKIISGEKGLFVSMPSRKTPDGEYKDIVHPINTETREVLVKAIFDAYEEAQKTADAE